MNRRQERELRESANDWIDDKIHTVSWWFGVACAIYVAWSLG